MMKKSNDHLTENGEDLQLEIVKIESQKEKQKRRLLELERAISFSPSFTEGTVRKNNLSN